MRQSSIEDLATLRLGTDASLEQVQRAYRKLALEHHPDRQRGDKETFQNIKAAAERLSGTCCLADCCEGEVVSHVHEGRDNIRCLLKPAGSSTMVTLDEQAAHFSTERLSWVALQALEETFLCCCVLDSEQHVAIGSSRGRVHLVSTHCDTRQPNLAPISAGDGPVLSLVCVSEHLPLLLVSVAGRVTLLDYVVGCALQSLESLPSLFDGIVAETLCHAPTGLDGASSVLELRGDESSACPTTVCIAGVDERCGGGVLLSLRMDLDALLLDEADIDPTDSLQLEWRAMHDAPVYAVSAAEPSLLVAATGHACVLHHRQTGTVLRRLAAGSGVLYALALNPIGDTLLAAGSEEVVHVFNFPSGTKRAELHLPRGPARDCSTNSAAINALAFVDDRSFVSGGYDGATTRWQLAQPSAVRGCSGCLSVALGDMHMGG